MAIKISMVVATKDRPDDLRKMLFSLRDQTVSPGEIVIVDASEKPVEGVIAEFADLNTVYKRHWPPSASAQRNVGIKACSQDSTHIGFADDDITFERDAFEKMLAFWEKAEVNTRGASFNIRNYPDRGKALVKRSSFVEWMGLYSAKYGKVSPSGWQSIIPELPRTEYVDWIPSTAAVFSREVFSDGVFDEYYDSYSYLEDLDFSYSISRTGRLAVVANAGFSHFPSPGGRITQRQFGKIEVRNRLHFVKKHHLSLICCYVNIFLRLAMTVFGGIKGRDAKLMNRAIGNILALI